MVMKYEEKRLEFLREPTPQFEEMTVQHDSHGASGWLRLHRVGIRNAGRAAIQNVRVVLEGIEPLNLPYLPVPLQLMHDRPVDGRWTEEFSLNGGDTRFIDVASKLEWQGGSSGHPIWIQHVVTGVRIELPSDREYILRIAAYGNGAAPCKARYKLIVDSENRLNMSASE